MPLNYIFGMFTWTLPRSSLKVKVIGQNFRSQNELEALGQCIPPPRHVLPVSRHESGSGSVSESVCVIRIATKTLIVLSLAHCQTSVKISCKSVRTFLQKVSNKQTDKQTNNDDYISSLADLKMFILVVCQVLCA